MELDNNSHYRNWIRNYKGTPSLEDHYELLCRNSELTLRVDEGSLERYCNIQYDKFTYTKLSVAHIFPRDILYDSAGRRQAIDELRAIMRSDLPEYAEGFLIAEFLQVEEDEYFLIWVCLPIPGVSFLK